MFKQVLKNLPLADGDASAFFNNIQADTFEGDESFRATLRLLLHSRMQSDERINIKVLINHKKIVPVDEQEIFITNDTLSIKGLLSMDALYVVTLNGYSDESLHCIDNTAKAYFSAWHYHAQVSLYLSQKSCKTDVYIDEATRRTVILVRQMNQMAWHKMQSSVMKLLPWFFTSPLSEAESTFLRSLTIKDSATYVDFITTYAKNFNFHEDRLARLLNGFSMQHEKQRLEKLLSERSTNQHNFDLWQKKIADCIAKEQELNASILGVETLIQQGDGSELTEYFICNKSLHLLDVGNDHLNFVVTTYLEYFDQCVFDRFFANPNSYFYATQNGIMKKDEKAFKNLLLALYGDDSRIRIRVCAEYKLSLAGSLEPMRTSSNLCNFPQWLPHPHIRPLP